jgi:nucleoid-associated protein YgaU
LASGCPGVTWIAQDKQLSTVTVGEGQSLRDIAQEYLGDPDLWTEILRANGLSVADVHPGIKLKIRSARWPPRTRH